MRSFFVAVMLVALKCISDVEAATKCYRCLLAPPIYFTNETLRLCQHFDYSEKFIVNCPYSTYCMKKSVSANLPVSVNATERDCAPQKFDSQNYKNGTWYPEVIIEEPYEEGCIRIDDKGFRTSHMEYCYCRGDLCNTGHKIIVNKVIFFGALLTFLGSFRFSVF